jgi:radical SAM/CxCxxxxC motif protein YfkAB
MITKSRIKKKPFSPLWDPWDPWYTRKEKGKYELTSVEFTVTNLCNLRCEHCAVGEGLVEKEGTPISTDFLLKKLDQIESLQTISITGGEPVFNKKIVDETIRPLLRYAKERGIYTQLNSNLTLPLSRYEEWIHDIDVLHISYNYRDVHDFHRVTTKKESRWNTPLHVAEKLYNQLIENTRILSKEGVFISAETFLSPFTAEWILTMHQHIVEMGCKRHEVHPLYPSDFAQNMDLLTLKEYQETVRRLLAGRDPDIWILLGTLPFFPCSDQASDRDLWMRLHQEENVTVRQDPDGRNRLNVNIFTGDVYVTDFADLPALGNILHDDLTPVFNTWLNHPLAQNHHCFCAGAGCIGPNILVSKTYYAGWDFTKRKAKVSLMEEEGWLLS